MKTFLYDLYDNYRIEVINLSNTRICNQFALSFLQQKANFKYDWPIQLILKECPMLDASFLDEYSKEKDVRIFFKEIL